MLLKILSIFLSDVFLDAIRAVSLSWGDSPVDCSSLDDFSADSRESLSELLSEGGAHIEGSLYLSCYVRKRHTAGSLYL